jgi:hypothetical protein
VNGPAARESLGSTCVSFSAFRRARIAGERGSTERRGVMRAPESNTIGQILSTLTDDSRRSGRNFNSIALVLVYERLSRGVRERFNAIAWMLECRRCQLSAIC